MQKACWIVHHTHLGTWHTRSLRRAVLCGLLSITVGKRGCFSFKKLSSRWGLSQKSHYKFWVNMKGHASERRHHNRFSFLKNLTFKTTLKSGCVYWLYSYFAFISILVGKMRGKKSKRKTLTVFFSLRQEHIFGIVIILQIAAFFFRSKMP